MWRSPDVNLWTKLFAGKKSGTRLQCPCYGKGNERLAREKYHIEALPVIIWNLKKHQKI